MKLRFVFDNSIIKADRYKSSFDSLDVQNNTCCCTACCKCKGGNNLL